MPGTSSTNSFGLIHERRDQQVDDERERGDAGEQGDQRPERPGHVVALEPVAAAESGMAITIVTSTASISVAS